MLEFEISYLDILKGVVITQVCIQLIDGFFNPIIFVMEITHVHQIALVGMYVNVVLY